MTVTEMCEELGQLMGDLDFGEALLETILLNGCNGKAAGYLQAAALDIRRARSNLSDALFEITTSPTAIDDDYVDEWE
ncbi:MAG: hypothetical protein Q4A32_10150 [Lachnospiraceae bacterium]|nr:hypothetical protein [Lachnospiraceae bacterium]